MLVRDREGRATGVSARVVETNAEGHRRMRFEGAGNILDALEAWGQVPLPPYIRRAGAGGWPEDRQRYQTVFARPPGSVAAPTAGLHFTQPLLEAVRARGVQVCCLSLHVGLGTFAPVKAETPAGHPMHEERYELCAETARVITEAKNSGRRVLAVGTSSLRALESAAARSHGGLEPGPGRTRLFIYPPWEFRIVDALLTNFHLPRSTLLMLVSAFAAPMKTCGRETLLEAYAAAAAQQYRFFSYGDAMLIL
jgi:S-adenosylmethionine:tRNA ribosyltransferase-isomerase